MKDYALWVDDARYAYTTAVERGAIPKQEPRVVRDDDGEVVIAAIGTYGDTIHSLVERRNYKGTFLPGFRAVTPRFQPAEVGLKYVDHCVGNVELGQMNRWVQYYGDVMGFRNLITFDDQDISTEYSSLMSKVMANGNDRIKFPINEPASGKKKSQIEEYLDFYRGPGAQHLALATDDIIETVTRLRDRGIEFLQAPTTYYQELQTACRQDRRAARHARGARHPGRSRPRRLSAADLHEARRGSPDAVLRDHSAQRREELREGELQGAVRSDRERAGVARESLAISSSAARDRDHPMQLAALPGRWRSPPDGSGRQRGQCRFIIA